MKQSTRIVTSVYGDAGHQRRWCVLLCAAAAVVSIWWCFGNALRGEFVHDDVVAVVRNRDVIGTSPLWRVFTDDFWGQPLQSPESHKSYRPLTTLTLRANFLLNSGHSLGFHAVNVFLHCVCTVLVMQTASFLFGLHRLSSIVIATIIFAVHPIHTEAVTSIVGRAEILSCCFFLLTLLTCLRVQQTTCNMKSAYIKIGVLSFASMLSKEQGITVLPVCIALELHRYWSLHFSKKQLRKSLLFMLIRDVAKSSKCRVFTLLATMFILLRCLMNNGFPKFSKYDNPAAFEPSIITRFLTYLHLAFFNLRLVLYPRVLCYDWQMGSIPIVESIRDSRVFVTIIVVLFMAFLFLNVLTNQRPYSVHIVAVFIVFFSYLPISNILITTGFVVAERTLYIPSVGVCLLIAEGYRKLEKSLAFWPWRQRFLRVMLLVLYISFVVRTRRRNVDWLSRSNLFESGVRDVPQNAKLHYNYANYLKDVGKTNQAIHHYEQAIELCSDYVSAHNNLGTVLALQNESEVHFKTALGFDTHHVTTLFNLAILYRNRGENLKSRALLERCISINSRFALAYEVLGELITAQNISNAFHFYQRSLHLFPKNVRLLSGLGELLQKQGLLGEALMALSSAHDIDPRDERVLINFAELWIELDELDLGQHLYEQLIVHHRTAENLLRVAQFFTDIGNYKRALKIYDEIENECENTISRLRHANLLLKLKQYNRAISIVNRVLRQESKQPQALHLLAHIYRSLGKYSNALRILNGVIERCEWSNDVCAAFLIERGDLFRDSGDFNTAAKDYEFSIRLDDTISHVHINIGVIRHIQGNYTSAQDHYTTALAIDPKNDLLLENINKLRRDIQQFSGVSSVRLIANKFY